MTKKQIRQKYRDWRSCRWNIKPDRARVRIRWDDETEERVDTIALRTYDVGVEDDDQILFYAGGLKGLLDLTDPGNGSDFVVTEVLDFYKHYPLS